MVPRRVAGVCVALVMTSAAGFAQQRDAAPGAPARITERTYIYGGIASSRSVERRSESEGREIVVVTEEQPGADGRWVPVEEIVTEFDRTDARIARTRRQVFGFDANRRRTLRETTESTEERLDGGNSRIVEETWVADINGGRGLVSRWIDERRTLASDVHQTDTTVLQRGINGGLRETERTVQIERQVEPAVVRYDSTRMIRDPNGRWTPIEARSAEVRTPTAGERIDEETIRRPNPNGTLTLSERIVTRRSDATGQEQSFVERYSADAEGFVRTDGRLALSQRIRRTTTATADGDRSTVEEVEARSRVSPSDPMRIVQRTLVTVRRAGPDRLTTERRVLERDVNGRLAPVLAETEEAVAK